jgi:hypothetical protein
MSAATLLSDSVRRALVRKANVAYLAQAARVGPATTPPAGLLNLSPTDEQHNAPCSVCRCWCPR